MDLGQGRVARYLTIAELSAATTLSVSTLRRLLKRGIIVGHQPGGPRHRLVFLPEAIEQATRAAQVTTAACTPGNTESSTKPRPLSGPQPKWTRST